MKRKQKILIILMLLIVLSACTKDNGNKIGNNGTNNDITTSKSETEQEQSRDDLLTLTDEDIKLLEKEYSDLSLTDQSRIQEIKESLTKYSLDDQKHIEENIMRLDKEKESTNEKPVINAQLSEEDGKIYKFNPGFYGLENNLQIPEAGSFNFVFEGKGQFTIYDRDNEVYFSEYINANEGFPKVRGFLFDGWSFETDEDLITYMQLNQYSLGGTDFDLYRGHWIGGRDIDLGEYIVSYFEDDILEDFSIVIRHTHPDGTWQEENVDTKNLDKKIRIKIEEGDNLIIHGISKVHLHPES